MQQMHVHMYIDDNAEKEGDRREKKRGGGEEAEEREKEGRWD